MAARERRGELGPSGEEWAWVRARMGLEPVYLYWAWSKFIMGFERLVTSPVIVGLDDDSQYYAINICSTVGLG